MILTIAHTFAYALIQTFGFSIFTLALQRLGRLKRLYRLKAFFFLLLMHAAGTMTYSALFLIGMAFFFASHLYLGWKRLRK